jgi:D-tyrosyl-tRNA(Tyr) deacylase
MRAVVQRVSSASVSVDGQLVGRIGAGLLALIGVAEGDGPADIEYVASKIQDLRIFDDDEGRMNRSVVDVKGAVLVVSQFTLMGDARKGRRPAFDGAAAPDRAKATYEAVVAGLESSGVPVATGVFRARMQVELVNDGPVTILLDSRRNF